MDKYNIDRFKKQAIINKLVMGLLVLICIGLFIGGILIGGIADEKYLALSIFMCVIGALGFIFTLTFWIMLLVQNYVRYFKIDGCTIHYYVGYKYNFLFIDKKYVDRSKSTLVGYCELTTKINDKTIRLEFIRSSIPRVLVDEMPVIIKEFKKY